MQISQNRNIACSDQLRSNEQCFSATFVSCDSLMLKRNGVSCYITGKALIFLNERDRVEILSERGCRFRTVIFPPNFININLSLNFLNEGEYKELSEIFHFPSFRLFYYNSPSYNGIIPIDEYSSEMISDLFDEMLFIIKNVPMYRWTCEVRSRLFRVINYTETYIDLMDNPPGASSKINVSQIVFYMLLHIGEKLTLESIAKVFGTNRTTLSNQFRDSMGISVYDYIINKRVELASFDLEFTEIPIGVIAVKNGFADAPHLTRAFRKHRGMTPLEYRDSTLKKRKEFFMSSAKSRIAGFPFAE